MMVIFILSLLSIFGLGSAGEICYDPCGCFVDDPPFNNMPLPENPNDIDISNLLFTRQNRDIAVDIEINNVPSEYNSNKRTVIFIHGWQEVATDWNEVKDTMLEAFDYNVILVNWALGGSRLDYWQSASNTRMVGGCTAALLRHLIQYHNSVVSNMYCVGLSLGGQTCGFLGKSMNGTMPRITALDPAGPAFEKNESIARLDKSDAALVDTIHTDGVGFGLGYSVSDVDFYPNNGTDPQPPCAIGVCSHLISRQYYRASIDVNSGCRFTSYPCNSHADAGAGLCNSCVAGQTCQRMGFHAESEAGRGKFYLTTVADYPYCNDAL